MNADKFLECIISVDIVEDQTKSLFWIEWHLKYCKRDLAIYIKQKYKLVFKIHLDRARYIYLIFFSQTLKHSMEYECIFK